MRNAREPESSAWSNRRLSTCSKWSFGGQPGTRCAGKSDGGTKRSAGADDGATKMFSVSETLVCPISLTCGRAARRCVLCLRDSTSFVQERIRERATTWIRTGGTAPRGRTHAAGFVKPVSFRNGRVPWYTGCPAEGVRHTDPRSGRIVRANTLFGGSTRRARSCAERATMGDDATS